MVCGLFDGIMGHRHCANCRRPITGKPVTYGGKAFCSTRCMDIYRHGDLSRLEK